LPIKYLGNYEQRMSKWATLKENIDKIEKEGKMIYIDREKADSLPTKLVERVRVIRQKPKFCVIPSPPDDRDYRLCQLNIQALRNSELPKKVINPPPPWILDQENTPFCGGASGAGSGNAHYKRFKRLPYKGFSMTFLYWLAKMYDGAPDVEGTYIRTINKVMKKYGLCEEVLAPFDKMKTWSAITTEMIENAEQYKIESYGILDDIQDIKSALADGNYVIIGTIVTSKNWNTEDGFLGLPHGYILGGHATFLYGYDDDLEHGNHKGYFYGVNSWGDSWGDEGKFYLPYDYYHWESKDIPGFVAFLEAWAVKFQELTPPNDEDDDENDDEDEDEEEIIDPNVFYRVITGSFNSRKKAEQRVLDLKEKGFDSFILKYNKTEDEENDQEEENGNDGNDMIECPATFSMAVKCLVRAVLNIFKRKG